MPSGKQLSVANKGLVLMRTAHQLQEHIHEVCTHSTAGTAIQSLHNLTTLALEDLPVRYQAPINVDVPELQQREQQL